MTKKQMILDALAELGSNARNQQIITWIKQHYNTFVHYGNINHYRKQYAAEFAAKGKPEVMPSVAKTTEVTKTPPDRTGKMMADEGKLLARPHAAYHPKPSLLVIHLRALIEDYGAEEVQDMLTVLTIK